MARKRTRPSYRRALEFIAWNDEPQEMDVEEVRGFISTIAVAVAFGKDAEKVAADVVKIRETEEMPC